MSRYLALALVVLAACDLPPFKLKFRLTAGDAQKCIGDRDIPTTDCSDVTMTCDAVLSVRVVPPSQPEFPYISLCEPLVGAQDKLCSIAGVNLPPPNRPVPEQVLEVQMAVFPRDALSTDADGKLICPRVEFAANGLPETSLDCTNGGCPVRPAVGGRAFYYPGDEETVVELGCTDLQLLRGQTCEGPAATELIATVNDFDTWVQVASTTADRLTVSFGEPKGDLDNGYSLVSALPLARAGSTSVPTWGGSLDKPPQNPYCIEVFEDVPQATRSLVCRQLGGQDLTNIDAVGALLSKTTLTDILRAKGRTTFPEQGLVVGTILNRFNQPVASSIVTPSCPVGKTCTIEYLSADRQSFTTDHTSSTGIWISTNAPFGTTFEWSGQVMPGFGGLVQGKVTIVVLQESAQIGS